MTFTFLLSAPYLSPLDWTVKMEWTSANASSHLGLYVRAVLSPHKHGNEKGKCILILKGEMGTDVDVHMLVYKRVQTVSLVCERTEMKK